MEKSKEIKKEDLNSQIDYYSNLKHLAYFSSSEKKDPLERKNIIISNDSRVFEINNFLSLEECEYYIKQTEEQQYDPVAWEYTPQYRDCERIILTSNEFAFDLWERLKPLLTLDDLCEVKPFGFDNEGTWQPIGINECFRFTKYSKGGHFNPHRDGGFVRTDEERSIYTIMIYLNDASAFEGGHTKFLSKTEKGFDILAKIEPKAGKALIFNHDIWHEGETINSGFKYIVRSDIMFRRLNGNLLKDKEKFTEDPLFIQAMKLYDESILFQKQGNPKLSTEKYLEALNLQAMLKSIPSITQLNFFPTLPNDISRYILSFLTDIELVKYACVSRDWKRNLLHPLVWKGRYKERWSGALKVEGGGFSIKESTKEYSENICTQWYILYKNRVIAENNFEVLSIDIDHDKIRYSMPNNYAKFNGEIESVIAKMKGHYWSATSGLEDVAVGPQAMDPAFKKYCYLPEKLVTKDKLHEKFYRAIFWIYLKGFSRPLEANQHPLLIAKPVWLFYHNFQFAPMYRSSFMQFYLCIVDAPILSLLSWNGSSTGIVVSVSDEVATVACVFKGIIASHSVYFKPEASSSQSDEFSFKVEVLASMTHSCLKNCIEEEAKEMVKCILLRGKGTLKPNFDETFSSALLNLGVNFHLISGNERIWDVIQGANLFITEPFSKEKFFHFNSAEPIPKSFSTPGNVSWEGELYVLSDEAWKLMFCVIDRKKQTISFWQDKNKYLAKENPQKEILIDPSIKLNSISLSKPKKPNGIYSSVLLKTKSEQVIILPTRELFHSTYPWEDAIFEIKGHQLNKSANPYCHSYWPFKDN